MTEIDDVTLAKFVSLFRGYDKAYGTGRGGWIKKPPTASVFRSHLEGRADSIGIGPLTERGTCYFAAIDLDRPDFDLALEMMKLLPGVSWLERSRSGNAHVLVFFRDEIEAWIPRGIMREACAALGERTVEVFPKTDRLLPGMVGNYLNLPYFGENRPIIAWKDTEGIKKYDWVQGIPLRTFVTLAIDNRNDADDWRKRARWLSIPSPEEREESKARDFGTAAQLHMCAQYVLEHRDDNPVVEGHRAAVYFALARQLANWSETTEDEDLSLLALINDASPAPISMAEMSRIYSNAVRGRFTSTGCDDPLFLPYAHPDCPIAKGA